MLSRYISFEMGAMNENRNKINVRGNIIIRPIPLRIVFFE